VAFGPRRDTTGDTGISAAPSRAPDKARNAAEFAILVGELLAAGYEPLAPTLGAVTIDTRFAADASCDVCGTVGLSYQPFSRPGSYIAFAHCRQCGAAEEF